MAVRNIPFSKVCRKCAHDLLAALFYEDPRYKDGLYPYCKECKCEMSRSGYKKKGKS